MVCFASFDAAAVQKDKKSVMRKRFDKCCESGMEQAKKQGMEQIMIQDSIIDIEVKKES